MKKAIYSVFITILLLLSSSVSAFAVEPLVLHVEGYAVKDNAINVYCNTNLSTPPASTELTVSMGNTNLPIKEIKEFSTANQGISIIFIADVSGSISEVKLQSIKDTLNSIADRMSPLDNASVLMVGNEAYTSTFVSDKEQIKSQISAIKGMSENTNLYLSIVKALDILSTNSSCNTKKCIVILSDGEDYGIKGITREEVNKKIEKLRIPIYTAAMLGTKPAEKYIQTSKILGSFARLSPGGVDYVHELTKDSSSKIADGIKSSIDKSLIVTADLSGFKSDGNEMYMKLELEVAGQGKTSDGYTVATGGLFSPSKEPDHTAQPPAESGKKSPSKILWLIIGVTVIVLIGAIIIILKKRREPVVSEEPIPETAATDEDTQPITEDEEELNNTINEPEPEPEIIKTPDMTIRLTKIGRIEEQVYHSDIIGELVIGRDPSESDLSFPKDDWLSSRHCKILYDSGNLILQDLDSTNGTYVNGVPINGPYKLENDDIILIGSMELRINW